MFGSFKVIRVLLSTVSPNFLDFDNENILHGRMFCSKEMNMTSTQPQKAELNKLIKKGVFNLMHKLEAVNHNVYGSHFCNCIKNTGKPSAFAKFRVAIKAFEDQLNGLLRHTRGIKGRHNVYCSLSKNLSKTLPSFSATSNKPMFNQK